MRPFHATKETRADRTNFSLLLVRNTVENRFMDGGSAGEL